jgi:NAD dependent epimerase/dehydratase family enzyme
MSRRTVLVGPITEETGIIRAALDLGSDGPVNASAPQPVRAQLSHDLHDLLSSPNLK